MDQSSNDEVTNLVRDARGICTAVQMKVPKVLLAKMFEPFYDRLVHLSLNEGENFWDSLTPEQTRQLGIARRAHVQFSEKPDREISGAVLIIWVVLLIYLVKSGKFEPETRSGPPHWASYLVNFIPKSTRETLKGDLEELYPQISTEHGIRKANWWYCWTVCVSVWPLLWREAQRLAKLISKLKIGL